MNQDKWAQPGWRTEQKYANKVLLGNWAEERLQFSREAHVANSTSRADYRPQWDVEPDASERRSALLRAEGLPSKLLFAHSDLPSTRHLTTHYEESYGRNHSRALPNLQSGPDSPTRPESNPPAHAASCGLLRPSEQRLPPLTTYSSAYQRPPRGAFCQSRWARAPRRLSSHLHTANHNHKDLGLRWRSLLQVPDPCFSAPSPRQRAAR